MPLFVSENEPLAPYTTLNIGGPARLFVEVKSETEITEAFEFAASRKLDVFVLGGGSNIVVSDNGFDGLVIKIGLKGIGIAGGSILTAAAGEEWDPFVEYCVNSDLAGLECLSGIPGSVGGTPVQNVGAYGQDVSESIVSVRCFDRPNSKFVDLTNAECGFEYRKSIFNSSLENCYVVVAVTYRLQLAGGPKLVYKDLIELFEKKDPTLREVRDAVLEIRRSKSMVIDPNDPNSRSAGSFFKNPIVPIERYHEIAGRFDSVPRFPAFDGSVKIPAAWLIEQAGFPKGYRKGRAGISTKHALAVINCGGANAAEVVELKNRIQETVSKKFGIDLIPEPVFLGFTS